MQRRFSGSFWRSARHWFLLVSVVALVLLADQISKAYVAAHLPLHDSWAPVQALEEVFRFTHVRNTGAAFGLFPQGGIVFLIIAIIVSVIILYYYRQVPADAWLIRLALGLQLGGALGNALDRLRQGYVVDFFDVSYWPVFNVADSCVVLGVGALVLVMLREERRERQRQAAQEAANEKHSEQVSCR